MDRMLNQEIEDALSLANSVESPSLSEYLLSLKKFYYDKELENIKKSNKVMRSRLG